MNRHNDKEIKDLVSSVIDAFNLRPKYMEYKVREFWTQEMSPLVTRHTANITIKGAKLYIKINSASVKHDLFIQRTQLKELINKALEQEFVDEVIFT